LILRAMRLVTPENLRSVLGVAAPPMGSICGDHRSVWPRRASLVLVIF
jgi:hypothetical protein